MGACASKFKVLRDAGDAPVPVAKEEVSAAVEGEVKKDIEGGVAAADDEAKRQSLGQMFKENEGEKVLVENDGKASEPVKQEDAPEVKPQENETAKSLEPVADSKDETEKAPASDGQKPETSEEKQTEDVKPENLCVEAEASQKIIEEKPVEIPKLETSEKVEDKPAVEPLQTEEPEEKKPKEKSATDKKLETPEANKTEEQKPASDAENSKA